MKKIWKIINIIKERLSFRDLISILFIPLILFINLFVGKSIKKKHIWLISEDKDEACDNGYVLFKYIKENRRDINCYYVINFKAKDYQKIKKYKTVIKYKSLKHWLYYLNSAVILESQNHTNPFPLLFYILYKNDYFKIPRVFLQHGVIKDEMPYMHYPKLKYRMFICGAYNEYKFVRDTFEYPKNYVVYTGLARFDNLDIKSKKIYNNILIAPTWRVWLNDKGINEYFNMYNSLLNNKKLINYIEKNNIHIDFVLHKNLKKYKEKFYTYSNNITINNNKDINIQDLFNKSDFLITDYSSLFFDMAYRHKPILYYQFDYEKFREMHYKEGYFSYERDGFGPVVYTEDKLIKSIIKYCDNKFVTEDKYLNRMINFFPKRDKYNSYRIVREVEKMLDKN